MANSSDVRHIRWDDLPKEKLTDFLDRRIITGEKAMLTHVYMKKGCVVPLHHHENEQLTYVLEGALKFWVGSEDAEPIVVRTGEVLVLPSNVPHKAEALEDTLDVDVFSPPRQGLEDTLDVDIFSPPRQDWLDGTDDYLRQQ